MARFPPPMTMITSSIPDSIASSTPYWMVGLSTRGSISLGCALVTGRKRVPSPAAVMIALRTGIRLIRHNVRRGRSRLSDARSRRTPGASRGRSPGDPTRRGRWRARHTLDDHADGADRPPIRPTPPAGGLHDGGLRGLRVAPGPRRPPKGGAGDHTPQGA